MARRKIEFKAGHYYHIFNRGSNRELIFRESNNYRFLLSRVKDYSSRFNISVIAYCFMPNHYHFLLRQNGAELISAFVQRTFNSYTKAFNKTYQRTGTLFEGPFKSVHIDRDNHLIHLCRYIHRNPLEAGLVANLDDWPYSNYLEWIGKRAGTLCDANFVQDQFINSDDYERFVLDYVPPKDMVRTIQNLSFED
ncbi:MAG: transposase [Anaerolineales bacterium]